MSKLNFKIGAINVIVRLIGGLGAVLIGVLVVVLYKLERNLKKRNVNLHLEVHASGHGQREDHRLPIQTLRPEIIIPGHGDIHKLADHATLAQE